jgi:hypothetical protein
MRECSRTVHFPRDYCTDQCSTRTQSALPLRLRPQVQTLLPRKGRRTGGCRTGQSRGRSGCAVIRGGHTGCATGTKTSNAPAMEGDHFSWLRPAHAEPAQGRGELSKRPALTSSRSIFA